MKIKHILIVLKKELKDMSRDKRTIISTILIPMIIIPLLYYFMGSSSTNLNKDIEENLTVAVQNVDNKAEIEKFLKEDLFKDTSNVTILDLKDPMQSLKDGDVRVVINIDDSYKTKLSTNVPFVISLIYDSSKMTSSGSLSIITSKISDYNNSVVLSRITALGLDVNVMNPTFMMTQDVAPKDSQNNQILSMILPMMLAVLLATSGAPAAIDLIVGERERKTFEALLTTKANRFSILLGKYLAIACFSMISVITSLIGVIIGMKVSPGIFGNNIGMNFNISPTIIVLSVLTVMLTGFMFAAIQLILSSFAKTIKEGQTYTSFLIFVVMIPAYATMFMQAGDVKMYMSAIPILNVIALIKMVISGMINYTYLLYTFGATLVYLAIIIAVTFNLFKKESIVIR